MASTTKKKSASKSESRSRSRSQSTSTSASTSSADVVDLNPTSASLLGFLGYGPQTGFDLLTMVEDIIGDFWNVTRSQIYRDLKVLAQLGLVETLATGQRDKQPYAITEAGREAFRAWIRQPPTPPIMRMPIVLEVFFGGDVPFEQLRAHVKIMRDHHAERLRVYESFAENAKEGTWPREALRLGFMFQRAMIDWLDSLPTKPLAVDVAEITSGRTGGKKKKKPLLKPC